MVKKLLLIVVIAIIGFIGFGVYLSSQATNKLNSLKDPLLADLNANHQSSSTDILAFLEKSSCPPISPHSNADDLSKHLLINHLKQTEPDSRHLNLLQKRDSDQFPQLDFSNLPLFIYKDTLYFANVSLDNPDHMAILEMVSPKLAQTILSCYYTNRTIPLIPNFNLQPFDEYRVEREQQIDQRLKQVNHFLKIGDYGTYSKEYFESQRHILTTQKTNLDSHVGFFKEPISITLIYDIKHNHYPDRYLATLIHEYTHYISFVSPFIKLERFFYDGLADHFTDRALENIGRSYSISYIEPVAIINDMFQEIPEKTLMEFMFSNDQKGLEELINDTYGAGFYDQNRELFLESADKIGQDAKPAADKIRTNLTTARNK